MIEVELRYLVNNVDKLNALSGAKLKARTAFQVGKLLREIEKEVQTFEKARADAVQKYGTFNDDGTVKTDENNQILFKDDDAMKAFVDEVTELLNTTVTLNAEKIRLDDIENVDFTPGQILEMEKLIEE